MEVDKATGRIKTYIDVSGYELVNNPDEADPLDTNPNNLTWDADGNLYIVDTGANTIYSWSQEDGLTPFLVWKDDPVPTAMRFASDGTIYVGFLGQGIAPGAGHIEHWSADGQTLIETFGGLNAVTDIALDADDNVYAVQLLQFGQQGPEPNSGSVVMVSADGTTTVADGLSFPYSLAQAPDGSWAVSVNSAFIPGPVGAVVKIGGGM
jgi:sugar lactone lactonase YvrE